MDTKSLDKQGKEHFQFYNNFMFAIKISIVVIVATLIVMAATLVWMIHVDFVSSKWKWRVFFRPFIHLNQL